MIYIVTSLLCFLHIVLYNSVCLIERKDVLGFGGRPAKVNSLRRCQLACIVRVNCAAVDWQSSNTGSKCWTRTSTATKPAAKKGLIVHYEIDRICSS